MPVSRIAGLATILVTTAALAGCVSAPSIDARTKTTVSGPYLGQQPPGTIPQLFAPGLVSTALAQRDTAISEDGRWLFYSVRGRSRGTIVYLENTGERWVGPEVAPFSGRFNDLEPSFEPGGRLLYFASNRPLPGEEQEADWNLWTARLEQGRWSSPQPVEGVGGEGDEFYPSLTRDGALYFTAELDDSHGGEDLYRVRRTEEGYAGPENLGPGVNSSGPEFNAFVAPDGSYLLFSSMRPGDDGGGDLYVSFSDPSGNWGTARPLGPQINSPALDFCPFVTPDGRYLFFSSRRALGEPDDPERPSYRDLERVLSGPGNGLGSLFWVDAGVIERRRP